MDAIHIPGLRETVEKIVSEVLKNQPQREQYLTAKQVEEEFSISYTTLWRWQKSGKLPVHRIGGKVFIKRSELINRIK